MPITISAGFKKKGQISACPTIQGAYYSLYPVPITCLPSFSVFMQKQLS